MPFLTICMPSNRDLEKSRAAITSALAYCEARDALLVVCDNSGDAAKQAAWEGASPRLIYRQTPGTDANANFLAALRTAETEFVLLMGDDDEIRSDPDVPLFDFAALPADFMGVRPKTEVFSSRQGVFRVKSFSILAEQAGDRLIEYNEACDGDNSAFYSIFRREPYVALMGFYTDKHPTKGGYCDWALSLSLFGYGRMAYDPGTVFRYNYDQWETTALLDDKTRDIYSKAGLPADAKRYEMLLMFLDVFIFLARRDSPLAPEQALHGLTVAAGMMLNGFIRRVDAAPHLYDESIRYIVDLAREERDIGSRFQLGLAMTEYVQPGLKDRYVAFYKLAMAA